MIWYVDTTLLAVQCSTVQCSTVQCSIVQCSTVQCSIVQCSTVQCSIVQCSTVQCSTVQCSAVQYSTVQCSIVQCSTVQYSTVQCCECRAAPSPSLNYVTISSNIIYCLCILMVVATIGPRKLSHCSEWYITHTHTHTHTHTQWNIASPPLRSIDISTQSHRPDTVKSNVTTILLYYYTTILLYM
jgi:hypothetical protein